MYKAKFLISLFLLAGFFISAQTGVTVVDSFYLGSQWRSFRVYKPNSYTGTTAVPLVFNFHGYTSNATAQQSYGNFMPIADTANFLVVHPQGTKDPNNQPYWNAGILPGGVNDLQFITQLIDTLKAQYNINPNKIYSTGLSNGGFMSNYLACNLSSKIAAIASVAGTMFNPWNTTCNPGRPVPAMHIHGTSDGTVLYGGGSGYIAADTLVKYWVQNTGSNPVPTTSNVPNTNTFDGSTATHYVYSGGISGSSVELYKVNSGGHTWPGSAFVVGVTCQDFNASVEIWRFFRKYSLSTFTGISEASSIASILVYPNPANDVLYIKTDQLFSAELYDVTGKKVLTSKKINQIDVKTIEAGIYFLRFNSGGETLTKKIIIQ